MVFGSSYPRQIQYVAETVDLFCQCGFGYPQPLGNCLDWFPLLRMKLGGKAEGMNRLEELPLVSETANLEALRDKSGNSGGRVPALAAHAVLQFIHVNLRLNKRLRMAVHDGD